MARIHSYVVRYDSGFAPNPFYGYCTLATCKPNIRRSADIGDWVVGSGSNDRTVRRGGRLVYAMRVRIVVKFMIDAMHHVAVLLHCPPCCVVQPRNP